MLTQWSMVFDIASRRVYFKTRKNPEVRWIALAELDLSPDQPAGMMNVDSGRAGNTGGLLADYSHEISFRHQKHFLERFGSAISDDDLRAWIGHFEDFKPA